METGEQQQQQQHLERQSRLAWNGEYPWDGVRRTTGEEIDKLLCTS